MNKYEEVFQLYKDILQETVDIMVEEVTIPRDYKDILNKRNITIRFLREIPNQYFTYKRTEGFDANGKYTLSEEELLSNKTKVDNIFKNNYGIQNLTRIHILYDLIDILAIFMNMSINNYMSSTKLSPLFNLNDLTYKINTNSLIDKGLRNMFNSRIKPFMN